MTEYNLETFKRFIDNLKMCDNVWYNYFKQFADAWETDIKHRSSNETLDQDDEV